MCHVKCFRKYPMQKQSFMQKLLRGIDKLQVYSSDYAFYITIVMDLLIISITPINYKMKLFNNDDHDMLIEGNMNFKFLN